MTWLALLLAGVGAADLARTASSPRRAPLVLGVAVPLVLAVVAGTVATPTGLVGSVLVAAFVTAWGLTVQEAGDGRSALVPLGVLGGGVLLAAVLAPLAPPVDGVWAQWLDASPWPRLQNADPANVLLLLGVVLAQLATGNHLVRLVLAATGTVAPDVVETDQDPARTLKGGRLLGPMERLVILGLGLAGEPTAAVVVIAAKGLLRWPELSSRRDQAAVHELTEYFLVGSFASWSLALAGLAVTA